MAAHARGAGAPRERGAWAAGPAPAAGPPCGVWPGPRRAACEVFVPLRPQRGAGGPGLGPGCVTPARTPSLRVQRTRVFIAHRLPSLSGRLPGRRGGGPRFTAHRAGGAAREAHEWNPSEDTTASDGGGAPHPAHLAASRGGHPCDLTRLAPPWGGAPAWDS